MLHKPTPKTSAVDLTDADTRSLEQYAQQAGLTLDQAATRLAKQTLAARYRRAPVPGARVLPLKRR